MSPVALSIVGLSVLSIGAQLWRGRKPERLAAVAFLIAMLATPLVDGVQINGLRWGVATLTVGLFGALLWLSLSVQRWWLIAAAGVQLLAIATYVVALLNPEVQVWASVSFRMVVWVELMLIALFGVWECRAAPYARSAVVTPEIAHLALIDLRRSPRP